MFESYPPIQNQFAWANPQAMNWNQNQQNLRSQNDIRFVNGIEEARNCMIPYGSRAILMDKEKDRFYIKETDLSGVSTVSEYEFKKVEAEAPAEYATKDDLVAFSNQIAEQVKQMKEYYESIVQASAKHQQSAQQRPAESSVSNTGNVSASPVYQNDFSAASQVPSGTAYQGAGNLTAGVQ